MQRAVGWHCSGLSLVDKSGEYSAIASYDDMIRHSCWCVCSVSTMIVG